MISLPTNWIETIEPHTNGPYGYYWRDQKRIVLRPPSWLFGLPLRGFLCLVRKHERTHAWGIIGCRKPYCLMFEIGQWKVEWKDIWWEKFAGIFQLFNFFRLCKQCKTTLIQLMNKESRNELQTNIT